MQIIEVTGLGVRSAVIRLRRRDTPLQFVVYPMIHVGQATFYADVTSRLRSAQVIVAEGVGPGASRRSSVLFAALTLSYTILKFNRRAGLVEQDIDYQALGVPVVNPDVDADEFRTSWRRIPLAYRLMMWCALPVVIIGRLFGGTEAIWSRAVEVNDLLSDQDEEMATHAPELAGAFGGERDNRLIAALQRLHEERASEAIEVAVVYGAGHVPSFVHRLRDLYGYVAHAAEWLTVADLSDTPVPPERVLIPGQTVGRSKATVREKAAVRTKATVLESPPVRRPTLVLGGRAPAQTPTMSAAQTSAETDVPEADLSEAVEVARLRGLAERQPDAFLSSLAHALMALSDRLADQGRPGEALNAADEAVDIAEDLRDRFGASYHKTCAWAAYTLGQRLRDVGRGDDATALYAEAVEIFRMAYRNHPYERAKSLGAVLTDHAVQLIRQHRYEESVAAAQEAIALFRAAKAEAPGEFTRPWAFALRNLASGLRAMGRTDEALEAAQRAVNIARRLVSEKPGQANILADNLSGLAEIYLRLDRTDDAVAAARESVTVASSLCGALPPSDRQALGLALLTLAHILSEADPGTEAVLVAAEAVAVWRTVAQAHPISLSNVSLALALYASIQRRTGTEDLGLASASEAEEIAREIATANPDRRLPLLAQVLTHVWRNFQAAGQTGRALDATSEAVRLKRAIAEGAPHERESLRAALEDHAVMFDRADRPQEARAARDEAMALGGTSTVDGVG